MFVPTISSPMNKAILIEDELCNCDDASFFCAFSSSFFVLQHAFLLAFIVSNPFSAICITILLVLLHDHFIHAIDDFACPMSQTKQLLPCFYGKAFRLVEHKKRCDYEPDDLCTVDIFRIRLLLPIMSVVLSISFCFVKEGIIFLKN